MQTVEEATKALWDYINSLPEDQKAKALEYQKGLEEEAAKTKGGMMQVVIARTLRNACLLKDTLTEVHEISAGLVANTVIKIANGK